MVWLKFEIEHSFKPVFKEETQGGIRVTNDRHGGIGVIRCHVHPGAERKTFRESERLNGRENHVIVYSIKPERGINPVATRDLQPRPDDVLLSEGDHAQSSAGQRDVINISRVRQHYTRLPDIHPEENKGETAATNVCLVQWLTERCATNSQQRCVDGGPLRDISGHSREALIWGSPWALKTHVPLVNTLLRMFCHSRCPRCAVLLLLYLPMPGTGIRPAVISAAAEGGHVKSQLVFVMCALRLGTCYLRLVSFPLTTYASLTP